MTNKTHFGFETINESEKESRVRGVFDSVANKYDLMNDFMSAGLHRLWKQEMVAKLSPRDGQKILDVAGGTGDIAFRIRDKADALVTVCDINQSMLNEGKNRAIDQNRLTGLDWICGNAEALPFEDASFDAYTIAFGIRNVTHVDKAIEEAYRVLKVGGRFLCLEFSQVPSPLLSKLYEKYSFHVIPWIGEKITGDRASYQYLVESIRKFPNQQKFTDMIKAAGFGNATYQNMTQGVVALHSARKL
jgi:demethylmenaquinone methyltransferase/2-methoxy-6-polyprenyl-1,4-benzoquinol methylase